MPVYLACVTTLDADGRANELIWSTPWGSPIVAPSSLKAAREARERSRRIWEEQRNLKPGNVQVHVVAYQSMPLPAK